ncbi:MULTISPECIES: hypothetical protein [Haloprofundus]|uniref:hypothetical protein n=1 Tax=Haloprofundus TaxID=1911573 RepID=UPI000E442E0A|nr:MULTISPECIES: hypothetical protein [Haloprofundus]QCJ48112.1 hypothetical protein FCF25_13705 [Haloprofundus sp. MHR1]
MHATSEPYRIIIRVVAVGGSGGAEPAAVGTVRRICASTVESMADAALRPVGAIRSERRGKIADGLDEFVDGRYDVRGERPGTWFDSRPKEE